MKKSKRIYSGGKSVVHIKNSSGGFYKVKKSGKLGKNCMHYNEQKLTCALDGKWCKQAATCSRYKTKTINEKM